MQDTLGWTRLCLYTHFYQSYSFIVQTLEMIGYGLDEDQMEDYKDYADWDPSSKSDAQQILASISTFDFAVVFMTVSVWAFVWLDSEAAKHDLRHNPSP